MKFRQPEEANAPDLRALHRVEVDAPALPEQNSRLRMAEVDELGPPEPHWAAADALALREQHSRSERAVANEPAQPEPRSRNTLTRQEQE